MRWCAAAGFADPSGSCGRSSQVFGFRAQSVESPQRALGLASGGPASPCVHLLGDSIANLGAQGAVAHSAGAAAGFWLPLKAVSSPAGGFIANLGAQGAVAHSAGAAAGFWGRIGFMKALEDPVPAKVLLVRHVQQLRAQGAVRLHLPPLEQVHQVDPEAALLRNLRQVQWLSHVDARLSEYHAVVHLRHEGRFESSLDRGGGREEGRAAGIEGKAHLQGKKKTDIENEGCMDHGKKITGGGRTRGGAPGSQPCDWGR
jgi:hypothetical protein